MRSTPLKVLLDSTYLLPSFGIEVRGLSKAHIAHLRDAGVNGSVRFHCLSAVWIEVIGKICRDKERLGIRVDNAVDRAIKSLLNSGFYEWITPESQTVTLAFQLRMRGHKDNIDNLLYAASVTNNMLFLTMDEDLKEFLSKEGFETETLIDHESLLKKIKLTSYR